MNNRSEEAEESPLSRWLAFFIFKHNEQNVFNMGLDHSW